MKTQKAVKARAQVRGVPGPGQNDEMLSRSAGVALGDLPTLPGHGGTGEMSDEETITLLHEALEAAAQHLEFCGYGDKWERECAEASKLGEQIEAATRSRADASKAMSARNPRGYDPMRDGLPRRARMRIGRSFLAHFPARLPARTVGGMLGISAGLVERIEKLAAYRIVKRMKVWVNQ